MVEILASNSKNGFNLGSLEAESDQYLNSAFLNRSELDVLSNTSVPGCVVVGRTGTGKTALLKHIEREGIRVIQIVPEEMSLHYLSNSTILNYFESLGIRLDLFYKTLWKHVFVVELLKIYCMNDTKFENVISSFIDRISGSNHAKKKAVDYLRKWKDSFWQNTEHRIKEMENLMEKNFEAKMSIGSPKSFKDIIDLSSSFSSSDKESSKVKSEILHKAQSVVNDLHMQDISEIINLMKTQLFTAKKEKFIIIIDDLDKEWIDKKNVYSLIRAMLEAIKDLRDIEGTKIVIALRENLLRLVINNSNSRGVQREKYQSFFVKIDWTKKDLEELINNRLKEMMKGNYTNQVPTIENVLHWQRADRNNYAFEYMIDRTLMRPRDIIAFFNICIANASGKSEITSEIIKQSELQYSKGRLEAIIDEWGENYEKLEEFLKMLRGIKEHFTISAIADHAENFVNSPICTFSDPVDIANLELKNTVKEYNDSMDIIPLMTVIIVALYNTGVVGVKLSAALPYEYSFQTNTMVEYTDITKETKLCVHTTFHKALNIIPAWKQQ